MSDQNAALFDKLDGFYVTKSEHDWLERRFSNMTEKEKILFQGAMELEKPQEIGHVTVSYTHLFGSYRRRSPSQQAMMKQWGRNLLATRCTRAGRPQVVTAIQRLSRRARRATVSGRRAKGKQRTVRPFWVSRATSMNSVRIHPGHTAVTRMPRGAASHRRARLYRSRKALVAA